MRISAFAICVAALALSSCGGGSGSSTTFASLSDEGLSLIDTYAFAPETAHAVFIADQ